jgi:predicted Zn-dependent protease
VFISAALRHLPPHPRTRPELLLRGQALLQAATKAPQPDAAALAAQTESLQTWLALHPRDAGAWLQLAQLWQAQGVPLRAVRAEAEAHAARYDYAAAVDRFKAGQDLARRSTSADDHFEASIIDTRLRAVQSLLREQAAER